MRKERKERKRKKRLETFQTQRWNVFHLNSTFLGFMFYSDVPIGFVHQTVSIVLREIPKPTQNMQASKQAKTNIA